MKAYKWLKWYKINTFLKNLNVILENIYIFILFYKMKRLKFAFNLRIFKKYEYGIFLF